LEEEMPRIICIDELDKMPRTFQNQLLNFMESGRIKVDQMKRRYDFEIKGAKIFATCDEINRLSIPLQSRFRTLFLPKYSQQQFVEVAVKVLPRISENLARYIGFTVYSNDGDIRDVLSVGKLIRKSDGPPEVENMIRTLLKYGEVEEEKNDH
jgi:replication-associated recombination protein RarA